MVHSNPLQATSCRELRPSVGVEINFQIGPGIEPGSLAWKSVTLPLRHATSILTPLMVLI